MNTTTLPQPTPDTRATKRRLASAMLLFVVAATLSYSWLIEHFGYDDVLREPAADILAKFHAGGAPLVLAWFAFSMSALAFVPVALLTERLLQAHGVSASGARTLALASAVAQTIGLLRWVLVVPALATTFVDPASSPATRDAVLVVFDAVHRYGGMVIGEMVGQLLLAGWTAMVAVQLLRARVLPRWVAALGLLTLPFWLLGQTELLHTVIPAIPSIEVIPLAFMAWEAWIVVMAAALLISAWRRA